jgi:hypothetical protein
MSKNSRDLKLLRQTDHDVMAQYNELLGMRAELARLLSRSKRPSSRMQRITRRKRITREKSVGSETK